MNSGCVTRSWSKTDGGKWFDSRAATGRCVTSATLPAVWRTPIGRGLHNHQRVEQVRILLPCRRYTRRWNSPHKQRRRECSRQAGPLITSTAEHILHSATSSRRHCCERRHRRERLGCYPDNRQARLYVPIGCARLVTQSVQRAMLQDRHGCSRNINTIV